jgi:hypothetical protein
MKKLITGLAACGILSMGAVANAQQTTGGTPTATKHQMMKECMDRQVAKNDGSTKSQMKKTCKAEIKSGMSAPQPTPAPEPSSSDSSSTP